MMTDVGDRQPVAAPCFRSSTWRLLVLGLGLAILARDINGVYLWNSAIHSHFARNHIQYGLSHTKGYSTWGETSDPTPDPQRYLNHPPLLSLTLAVPMTLLGEAEWVGRTIPIAATLGSTWLLMSIVERVYSPLHGLFAGLFYVLLPVTAYFGRMIDHTAPVQFFGLIMLYSYLVWTNGRSKWRRRTGALFYALGAALGIGFGWGAALMPPLIFAAHACVVYRNRRQARGLFWICIWPSLALVGVMTHIAAATEWDLLMLGRLLVTRTVGAGADGALSWTSWLFAQARFFDSNFTALSAAAVIFYLIIGWYNRRRCRLAPRMAIQATIIIGSYGLLYLLVFRNQSYVHDYWQFLVAPFVAISWASLTRSACLALNRRNVMVRASACLLIIGVALPGFWKSWNRYFSQTQLPVRYIEAFQALSHRVPLRVPVLTSHNWPRFEESFGGYVNRWPLPQVAYYANRPLIHETELTKIKANIHGAPAYLLELSADPESLETARYFLNHYQTVTVGRHHLVALLQYPQP